MNFLISTFEYQILYHCNW